MPEPTLRLTEPQIAFFRREGYLTLEALTTPQDVAALRESYDRIFSQRAGRDEGNQFDLAGTDEEDQQASLPQILQPAKYAPEMNESLLLANAAAVGRQLLGDEATCGFAHAIFKPPQTGSATPWHQDAAYWNPAVLHRSISIWVPLQEATLDNGCMQFIPRSHVWDVLQHRSINNDPRIHGLELHPDEMWRVKDAVPCPLPPGGCTIHGGYMLHYTAANRSTIPRRALILGAQCKPEPRQTPVRFPWLEEKRTARQDRARASQSVGGT